MNALTHEEFSFSWWSVENGIAGYTSYRLVNPARAWYCWALWRDDRPTLHVTEFDIARRANPMIAKAPSSWAEYVCDAPDEQWSMGNETYAVELDDIADAYVRDDGLVFGRVVPIASDLEWYATDPARDIDGGRTRLGVVTGDVETDEGKITLPEMRGVFTHRWSHTGELSLWPADQFSSTAVTAHLGPRLAFRFPDARILHLTLAPDGWRRSRHR